MTDAAQTPSWLGERPECPTIFARIVIRVLGEDHSVQSELSPVSVVTHRQSPIQRECRYRQRLFHEQQGQGTGHGRQVLGDLLIAQPEETVTWQVPLQVDVGKIVGAVSQVQLELVGYGIEKCGHTRHPQAQATKVK